MSSSIYKTNRPANGHVPMQVFARPGKKHLAGGDAKQIDTPRPADPPLPGSAAELAEAMQPAGGPVIVHIPTADGGTIDLPIGDGNAAWKPRVLRCLILDTSIARSGERFSISGSGLALTDAPDLFKLRVRLGPDGDFVTRRLGEQISGVAFTEIAITHESEPGGTLEITYWSDEPNNAVLTL